MKNFMGCMNIIGFSNLMDGCKKVGKADPNDIKKKKKRLHQYAQLIFFAPASLRSYSYFYVEGVRKPSKYLIKKIKML